MTPARKRLKDMLALISANTKRIARGLPPLVEVSRPRVATAKRKPRRKTRRDSVPRRGEFYPPRAPETHEEPVFTPPPSAPIPPPHQPVIFRAIDDAEAARWGILADGSLVDDRRPDAA